MVGWLREVQYLAEFALLWPIVALVRSLSEEQAYRLGDWLAGWACKLLSRDRRWAYKNLDLVFGNRLSDEEKTRIVRASFENIVRTRIECLRWTREWMEENVSEVGGDLTRSLRDQLDTEGKGLIVITAHLGNYELLPAWCHFCGYPSTVMYRPQNNWRVERLILGARHEYLPNVVHRSAIGLMTLSYVLREGGNAGLLVDMNTLDDPVFVDFLGFQAASPPGAAALALATGAKVLLMMAVRHPNGKHQVISQHPPFETIRTGNKRRDIQLNTQQYMKAFESYILAHPEQYNWPHPRWRYRPDGSFWTPDLSSEEIAQARQGEPRAVIRNDEPLPACSTRVA